MTDVATLQKELSDARATTAFEQRNMAHMSKINGELRVEIAGLKSEISKLTAELESVSAELRAVLVRQHDS